MVSIQQHAAAIRLAEILPDARFVRATDIQFSACTNNPQQCRPGSLFVAHTSLDADSHEDAMEAVRQGASGVLAERLLPVATPQAIVRDTRSAYGRLAHALAGDPSKKLQVFAIAGGRGKTAAAVLLESILCAAGGAVAWRNSLASFDGQNVYDLPSHTTEVADLVGWLGQSVTNGCRQAVIEVTNEQLASHVLAGLECDVAVLHGRIREVFGEDRSKAVGRRLWKRLASQLKAQAAVVANLDDAATGPMVAGMSRPLLSASALSAADVTATILERSIAEQTFMLEAGPESVPVRTTLLGDHQISNCMSAAAAALLAGVDLATIARGLERVVWLPGQLERVECGQPFGLFVDGGSTPESVELALRSVRRVTRGRVIAVCGAKAYLASADRARLGRVLERVAHTTVLTNDDPVDEPPLEIIHDLLDGYAKPEKALVRPDRDAAIGWALSHAQSGDSVVLCGKALDAHQLLADGVQPWDEGERARQWLYRHQSASSDRPTLRIIHREDD